MNILYECLRVRRFIRLSFWCLGIAGKRSFVVEAIKVAASLLEVLNPLLWLCNHHMTIKGTLGERKLGLRDMRTDLRDDRSTEGYVRDEMTVHDIDMQPISASSNG